MTNQDRQSAALPKREPVVHPRRRGSLAAAHRGERWGDGRYMAAYRRLLARHRRLIRRVGIGSGVLAGALQAWLCLGLWWRLASGPIQLDASRPGLLRRSRRISAAAACRGRRHPDRAHRERRRRRAHSRYRRARRRRHGGGERAESRGPRFGHEPAQRPYARRKPQSGRRGNGTCASSGMATSPSSPAPISIRSRRPRCRLPPLLSSTAIRDPRGRHQRRQPPAAAAPGTVPSTAAALAPPRGTSDVFAALLSWIDGIGETGLDGHDLRELGLKDGNLTVDDERTGKDWAFAEHHSQPRAAARRRCRGDGRARTIPSGPGD